MPNNIEAPKNSLNQFTEANEEIMIECAECSNEGTLFCTSCSDMICEECAESNRTEAPSRSPCCTDCIDLINAMEQCVLDLKGYVWELKTSISLAAQRRATNSVWLDPKYTTWVHQLNDLNKQLNEVLNTKATETHKETT